MKVVSRIIYLSIISLVIGCALSENYVSCDTISLSRREGKNYATECEISPQITKADFSLMSGARVPGLTDVGR